MAKKKKTDRDLLSDNCKLLTKLLFYESTGGIIPLPKGVDKYTPPPIPFNDRKAFLDSASKGLLIDLKINPDSEESGFELLKEELDERNRKRNSDKTRGRGVSTTDGGDSDDSGESDSDFLSSFINPEV